MSNLIHLLQPHLEATLRASAYEGSFKECNLLLNMSVNPLSAGPGGKTALHLAAMGGHNRILTRMLQHLNPEDINCIDQNGQTALHLAARRSHVLVIETLLQYGADHTIVDVFNRCPLELCPTIPARDVFEQHLIQLTF